MGRKKKSSGTLKRGPFTFKDLEKALKADGWTRRKGHRRGSKHHCYEHPTKTGKPVLAEKWDSIQANDQMFRSVAAAAGLSKRRLLELLNR